MFDQYPLLLAALVGFLSGFILSVPVGPVNLTIMNEGARNGLRWALLIGFGATAMEVFYCALAFTGFASFFDGKVIKAVMELTTIVFLLYLGIRFLTVKTIPAMGRVEDRFKARLNPQSAFAIGFVRVMGNPGVFLFWIVLAANFKARGWVPASRPGVFSCVAGVAAGINLWFSGLSYAVSRGHRKFTDRTLLRMERGSGVCLLALAIAEAVHFLWQMSRHQL
jgi:threonine/homoserine/homoserine lactone efflux protein